MKVIIDNYVYTLNQQPIGVGGEGEVYEIDNDSAVKVYDSQILNDERKRKVLSLCNTFSNNIDQFQDESFAFPQFPAFKNSENFDSVVGFSMDYFKGCPQIEDLGYDLNLNDFRTSQNFKFDDKTAVDFIYDLFSLLNLLHKARIVLGDINTANILCEPSSIQPVFIDMDAVKIGQFDCMSFSPEYLDPLIEIQGTKQNGCYMHSSEGDIFSLACVCYHFFIGAHPFFMRTKPPHNMSKNKEKGNCLIRCYSEANDDPLGLGVNCLRDKNIKHEERLKILEQIDPILFKFFVSTFVKNNRSNLVMSLPSKDPRNPRSVFFVESGFGKIIEEIKKKRIKQKRRVKSPTVQTQNKVKYEPNFFIPNSGISKILGIASKSNGRMNQTRSYKSRQDPPEFKIFLNNYGIDYNNLIGGN